MGTLTQKEREGLDEIFLSIHTHPSRAKYFLNFFKNFNLEKWLKVANYGLQEEENRYFLFKKSKKKKNLSK